MYYFRSGQDVYCHWCGGHAKQTKSTNRHAFCSNACKMAHHRAYKKYVTQSARQRPGHQAKTVTPKKPKKRKCDTCSANPNGCALWKNPNVRGCKRYLKKRKKRG